MIDTAELRSRIAGVVLSATDEGFAAEVAGFNLAIEQTPDVAVGAASTSDVVDAVRFARELALPVRVQSTGHGAHERITDGVLITTRRLNSVKVDPATRIATIGGGARWSRVIAAGAPLGLAPVGGASPAVGVVGYLTGGGFGPLARSHGVSSDLVRGFTVVTGTGDVVEASATSNPDLFWALRGGKTGFGIVTEVRLELVELPSLYAGSLLFENQHIEKVLRGWLDYTHTADDAVTTSVVMLRFPPIDAVPEPMRGKNFASVRFAFPGEIGQGKRLAAPLRALAPVFIDSLGELPIDEIGLVHNDPEGPSPSWSNGTLLSHDDPGLADAVLAAAGPAARIPFVAAELRHLGAATAVDVPEGSAVGGRSGRYTFTLIAAPEPSLFQNIVPEAANRIFEALRPWINAESNVNFSGHGGAGTPNWSPAATERLAAVRAAYDPDRVFARP
ncbi:FAD-binding oxidoreductase [Conyzicola nivalis]|uniref:FAD-linked oxidase n=1 Tax=Conyzicola nivalis TaxID=1477021 RepID=A0A916WKA0_9MICO|nr:FAD-binding oxidoreductase [Conyzicola nivalis]GGB08140.1 FAD-linked oxidase [Conyzicola nivalis]